MADNPIQPPSTPEKAPAGVEDIFAPIDRELKPRPEVFEQKPEIKREARPEVQPEKPAVGQTDQEIQTRRPAPPAASIKATPAIKSPELIKIESILSENMDELFMSMSPEQQLAFKRKGEETASRIQELLAETKVKIREILELIKDWLKLIPGINKFFLEQEAKIKTDRLLITKEQK